jgi:hypothetical protein
LEDVLASDDLAVESEGDVLHAVLSWCGAGSARQVTPATRNPQGWLGFASWPNVSTESLLED